MSISFNLCINQKGVLPPSDLTEPIWDACTPQDPYLLAYGSNSSTKPGWEFSPAPIDRLSVQVQKTPLRVNIVICIKVFQNDVSFVVHSIHQFGMFQYGFGKWTLG